MPAFKDTLQVVMDDGKAIAVANQRAALFGRDPTDVDNYLGRNIFRGADGTSWSTGEDRIGKPYAGPDYISIQGSSYVLSFGAAINLRNGDIFGQWALGRSYTHPQEINSVKDLFMPSGSVNLGFLAAGTRPEDVSEFLDGGGWQIGGYYPTPVLSAVGLGLGGGINHSYGGLTSVEVGIGTVGPRGVASVAPVSVGF